MEETRERERERTERNKNDKLFAEQNVPTTFIRCTLARARVLVVRRPKIFKPFPAASSTCPFAPLTRPLRLYVQTSGAERGFSENYCVAQPPPSSHKLFMRPVGFRWINKNIYRKKKKTLSVLSRAAVVYFRHVHHIIYIYIYKYIHVTQRERERERCLPVGVAVTAG